MSMKAVMITEYGAPEVLKVKDVPIPQPQEGEVLIKVRYAGVNPADASFRSGNFRKSRDTPFIAGGDAAGMVEAVGPGVTVYKEGDRVYTVANYNSGTYAEYTVAPTRIVASLNDSLTFAQGAAIGIPYWTAHKALYNRAHTRPEETVLIHGASGAVGTAAIQIAKANGHFVIGTAGTKQGMELVKKLGADLVFDHKDLAYTQQIMDSTNGKGVNVILEMLANVNLDKDLDLLAFRGRVVVVGCRGSIEIQPRKTMFKETSIIGISLTSVESEEEWKAIADGVKVGQASGWLRPVVGREYAMNQAVQSHHDIMNNTGTFGKLVLKISE